MECSSTLTAVNRSCAPSTTIKTMPLASMMFHGLSPEASCSFPKAGASSSPKIGNEKVRRTGTSSSRGGLERNKIEEQLNNTNNAIRLQKIAMACIESETREMREAKGELSNEIDELLSDIVDLQFENQKIRKKLTCGKKKVHAIRSEGSKLRREIHFLEAQVKWENKSLQMQSEHEECRCARQNRDCRKGRTRKVQFSDHQVVISPDNMVP